VRIRRVNSRARAWVAMYPVGRRASGAQKSGHSKGWLYTLLTAENLAPRRRCSGAAGGGGIGVRDRHVFASNAFLRTSGAGPVVGVRRRHTLGRIISRSAMVPEIERISRLYFAFPAIHTCNITSLVSRSLPGPAWFRRARH
jgi:hypothetical protein